MTVYIRCYNPNYLKCILFPVKGNVLYSVYSNETRVVELKKNYNPWNFYIYTCGLSGEAVVRND